MTVTVYFYNGLFGKYNGRCAI